MEKRKDGFVYLWFDKKHKRYYVGCHWKSENDGYICSSNWMRDSYKRRPTDFKRRIIQRLSNCTYVELLEAEYKWLDFIKDEELGKRYYNLYKKRNHWASMDASKTVGQKISESHKANPGWGQWAKGKVLSVETKDKIRAANKKQFEDEEQREIRRKKSKELWADPEYRAKQIAKKTGIKRGPRSEETKRKIGEKNKINMLNKWKDKDYREMQIKSHIIGVKLWKMN